ncbi:MAG: choice-of-anchor Q domain-containing protein [Planctomycetota bacterium]|nr:choice-of-anchor Q domain-containing protein [Planctomycetota bacterium]
MGGDYRLAPGSPCIDAGDNMAVPEGVDTDLDGNPRFVDDPATEDTGNGEPPIVDMGAYEFPPPPCPGDFDDNGRVDAADLLILLGQWGTDGAFGGDVDRDGDVDTVDLLALLGAWGECPE